MTSTIQRRLMVLLGACLAGMALAAPSALADPVEVLDSTTEEPCPEIVQVADYAWEGGCEADFSGLLTYGVNGSYGYFGCNLSFTLRVGPEGAGLITNPQFSGSGGCGGVGWKACPILSGGSGPYPWNVYLTHDGASNISAVAEQCIQMSNYSGIIWYAGSQISLPTNYALSEFEMWDVPFEEEGYWYSNNPKYAKEYVETHHWAITQGWLDASESTMIVNPL